MGSVYVCDSEKHCKATCNDDCMDTGRLHGPRYPLEGCGGGRECLEHILEVEQRSGRSHGCEW